MKNLFQPDAANEVVSRINKLQPTQHQWDRCGDGKVAAIDVVEENRKPKQNQRAGENARTAYTVR